MGHQGPFSDIYRLLLISQAEIHLVPVLKIGVSSLRNHAYSIQFICTYDLHLSPALASYFLL